MTKTEKRVLFFEKIALLISELANRDIHLMPTCFYRTIDEQTILFERCKSKTMDSKHLGWLAMDFVLVENGELVWGRNKKYEIAGALWEEMGGTWGGRWESLNDIYHFEFKDV